MGYSSHIVAKIAMETLSEPHHVLARAALGVYLGQLGVNLLWTPIFFGKRNPRLALLNIGVLGGLVGVMTGLFWSVDRVSGLLCLPYLAWIGYAGYLNYSIVKLNPGDGNTK
jgi:translocator protein